MLSGLFYFYKWTHFISCLRFETAKTIEKLSFLAKVWIVVEIPIIKFRTSWNSSGQHTSQIEGRQAWSAAYIKYQKTFMILLAFQGNARVVLESTCMCRFAYQMHLLVICISEHIKPFLDKKIYTKCILLNKF